jgi:hypothetical protein
MASEVSKQFRALWPRQVSQFAQSNVDYRSEPSFVTILCQDNSCRYRPYEPLESILGKCERTEHQSISRPTKACEILALIDERICQDQTCHALPGSQSYVFQRHKRSICCTTEVRSGSWPFVSILSQTKIQNLGVFAFVSSCAWSLMSVCPLQHQRARLS